MKKGHFKIFFLLLILKGLFVGEANAQYFLTGQDPASVKWNQIKTEHFQIIYPREYAEMAQYYINLMTLTSPFVSQPYIGMEKQKRLSVILHNRTSTSNALVAIAPFRADFFEMPPQDTYPQIWQDQLALHEYRHAVQMNALRQGMTKGMFYIFGEQAIGAVMGLWLPFWFIEGDAVYAETINSNSGRGRVPDFIYPLKAQILDKKIYKYDKASFGSFRDFVPNHYTLGYHLVAKGINEYGIEMWSSTIDQVARRPYYLVPFTTSIKKQTGKYKVRFYNYALKSLRNEWWLNDRRDIDSIIQILSSEEKFFTNYLFPNELEDGSIIIEKTGLDDINRFVMISPDGKEKRIFTPGYDFKEALSVGGNLLCWNEKGYDPRWSMRNYSVIKVYDLETKKLKRITKRSRYFAPHISNDGKTIVTVHVSEKMDYTLTFLDVETGNVIDKFSTEDNLFFTTPHWSDDNQYVVAIVLGKQGKSLIKYNVKNREVEYLLPFSYKEIKWPVMHGNWVVYSGAYEGKDNLYAIDVQTKSTYRLFEPRFGATKAAFSRDGSKVYFSYYTADGEKLAVIDFRTEDLQQVIPGRLNYSYLADKLDNYHVFNLDDSVVPNQKYPEKKYNKAGHLFNLHSWAPLSIDVDNYTIKPGATLLSQNVLSSSVATLSYLYDPNERTSKISFGYDYYGLYPVISLSVDYGGRRSPYEVSEGEIVELHWRETNLNLNLSVPLQLTRSKWVKGIQPSAGVTQTFLNMLGPDPDSLNFRESSITIPTYRLYAYNQYKRSPKDIYPHWGQSIDLIFRNTPLSESISSQTGLIGWVYFPGIVRHHGIRIYGGYQKTTAGNYPFSNLVAIPRGYTNVSYPEFFSIRSDYAFPIAYPDWNVPGAFYLKRIYSKLFYDYLQGNLEGDIYDLSSTGAEIYTDWNFLSFLVNFNLGVRVLYRFYDNTTRTEFLFGISTNF